MRVLAFLAKKDLSESPQAVFRLCYRFHVRQFLLRHDQTVATVTSNVASLGFHLSFPNARLESATSFGKDILYLFDFSLSAGKIFGLKQAFFSQFL